jgi:hypothetical protein
MTAVKKCRDCGCEFPATVEFFHVADSRKGLLRNRCRQCYLAYIRRKAKARYDANPQKYIDAVKAAYWADPEKSRENAKRKYANNSDHYKAKNRKYYYDNLEAIKVREKGRREKNREDLRRRSAEWRVADPERSKESRRRHHQKMKVFPEFRLRNAFSGRMNAALTGTAYKKGGNSWVKLVGYDVDELKAHLESLFQPGMTWDNYGEWHVDHIIPVSMFKYDSYHHPEFRRCWSLDNIQPLWAFDNMSKGATADPITVAEAAVRIASVRLARQNSCS